MKTHRGRGLVLGIGAALCLAGLLLLLTSRVEAKCEFPASGQTTAYPADKNGNPGAAVPDDGTVQTGKALRYEDKGKGWIRDKVTGLIWEKKSDDGGLHDVDNGYPWSSDSTDTIWDWLDDINTEGGTGFAGHNDWRIPNVKELLSIIDYDNVNPAVASAFNTNCGGNSVFTGSCTAASAHWSSSTFANVTSLAWYVHFSAGFVDDWPKSGTNRVRAVRGGCGLGPN